MGHDPEAEASVPILAERLLALGHEQRSWPRFIISSTAMDLARHIIGRGDKVHRDGIRAKGFKFSELLTMQFRSFGGEGYRALAEVLEKDTKVKD